MKLWQKVFIGLILGIILGVVLKEQAVYLKPFGDLFIRLIKMIIVPLIFFAIVSGITSVQDSKSLGRIGIKASITYLLTTLFAIMIGLSVGTIFEPGSGVIVNFTGEGSQITDTNMAKIFDTLLNVVFFALFTGITLNTMENDASKRLKNIFALLASMVFKMVHLIVQLSPIAAGALIAWIIGTQGMMVLEKLLKLVGCAYLAFGVQYLIFGLIIYFWTKLSPLPFFKKSLEYQAIAFSTSNTKAALPTTIKVCQNRLGVSKISSSFVLPLGASINVDGTAIYISLCALFFAQATGKVLGMADYGCIILTGTLGSIGAAGVTGGTIVMLPMVLGSIGLPIEGIALIAGIDRIVDMMRSTISITGDATVALCVDHSEGLLDRDKYNKAV
jgi:Na+/H+-dicarboxylate symporter